jgi:hypothetical protein
VFGITAGAITFIATWIYCAMTYGFELELGLGWFPAAICAGVIGCLVAIFWGVALLLLVLSGILLAVALSTHSAFLAYPLMGAVWAGQCGALLLSPFLVDNKNRPGMPSEAIGRLGCRSHSKAIPFRSMNAWIGFSGSVGSALPPN